MSGPRVMLWVWGRASVARVVRLALVPLSLPMDANVPELWSRLEYEAARARHLGRDEGLDVETLLVLSDSGGAAEGPARAQFSNPWKWS